jgi:hypothetical protein
VTREDDPEVVESIGIAETTTLATAVFSAVAQDYLSYWAGNGLDSEKFGVWLEGVKQLVIEGINELWRKDDWHTAWFNRAARKKLEDALALLVKDWATRAEALEIEHLENPHLDTVAPSAAKSRPICSDWRNLSPEDPRYSSWQLIFGVLQRDESQATANLAGNFKTKGQASAVLTLVEEKYDACGRAALMLASNVAKAQEVAELLTEVLEPTLAAFGPMFQVCEQHGICADGLSKQARIRLTSRLAHWKAQAFRCGLEGELRGLSNGSDKIEPAVEADWEESDAAATACRSKPDGPATEPSLQMASARNESDVSPTTLRDNATSCRTDDKEAAEEKIEVTPRPQILSASLSTRDTKVHKIVGEESFRTLTNAEIMKTRGLGSRLRREFDLEAGDASKSCLDRIRNSCGYPLSREVSKKRSAQS